MNQEPTADWELDEGRTGYSAVGQLELERNQAPMADGELDPGSQGHMR